MRRDVIISVKARCFSADQIAFGKSVSRPRRAGGGEDGAVSVPQLAPHTG